MSSAKKMSCGTPIIVQEKSWSSGTLGNDILRIYQDSDSSDVRLYTKGKSFTAHRLILGARSSVFRAMFEKDRMSESRTGVGYWYIEDVDSETMERFLLFIYGDSVENLQFEEAYALYYAANKYAVHSLKLKCRDIMKACLNMSNACEALALAENHSDEDLLLCVKNFIFQHDELVSSAEWERLEESHPLLTTKIIRELFCAIQQKVSTIMKAPSREDKGNKDDQSQKRKSPLQNNQLEIPTTIQQSTTLPYQFSPATTKSFSNPSGQPRYPEATYTSVNTIPSYTNVNTSVVRPNALRHHNPNATTAFTSASEIQTSCKPNVVKLQSPNSNISFTSANDSSNLFLQNPATYQTMTTVPQAFPSYSYRQASVNGAGNAATTVTTTTSTASYYPATNNVFTLQTAPGNPSQMYAQVLPNQLPQYVNHQGTPYFIVTDPNTIPSPQRYPLMNMQTVPFPN